MIILNILLLLLVIVIVCWIFPVAYVYNTHKSFEILFPIWFDTYFFYNISMLPNTTLIETQIGLIQT